VKDTEHLAEAEQHCDGTRRKRTSEGHSPSRGEIWGKTKGTAGGGSLGRAGRLRRRRGTGARRLWWRGEGSESRGHSREKRDADGQPDQPT